jgi:uncharacterized protein (TIGR02058 family)
MALDRIILEMGHGNDMRGVDYTKAALRAVQDCIHHSSLPFLRNLAVDPKSMEIDVTIGVQQPERVDAAAVAASLPYGQVKVNVVLGGLDVSDKERGGATVIAIAAVAIRLDLKKHLGIESS